MLGDVFFLLREWYPTLVDVKDRPATYIPGVKKYSLVFLAEAGWRVIYYELYPPSSDGN